MGRRSRRRQRLINLRESATSVLDRPVAGSLELSEAMTTSAFQPMAGGRRRYRAKLIEGDRWGSSGYYPRSILERDGPTAWPVGTIGYLDHPSASESTDRPERSVRDMAFTITSTPTYDGDGLYAEVTVFPHMVEVVDGLAEAAGLSIRAAGRAEHGEAQGRTGPIVTAITHGLSVDLVTAAGAGGRLVQLMESARTTPLREGRNVGAWLESRLHLELTQLADDLYGNGALTRDERLTLSSAIGDGLTAYAARVQADAPQLYQRGPWDEPETAAMAEARLTETRADETRRALDAVISAAYASAPGQWSWVRDFDPDLGLVWFDSCGDDGEGDHTWQQAYALGGESGDVLELSGTRVQVVARTEYEPVGPGGDAEVEDTGADEPAEVEPAPMAEASTTVARSAAPSDVTDGAPPAAPAPPTTSEGSETVTTTVSTTGPAPGTAGTVTGTEASTSAAGTTVHVVAEAATPTIDPAILERLTAVEAALTAERARGDQALAEAATLRAEGVARDTAARMLAEAGIGAEVRDLIGTRVTERVVTGVPMNEAGLVDQPALETRVSEAIAAERAFAARLLEAQGVGTVRGLGDTGTAESPARQQEDRIAKFTRLGLSEAAARTAAAGLIGGQH